MSDEKLYRLNDNISFRKCSLFDGSKLNFGNCTDFRTIDKNYETHYLCNQGGIHFHCTKHPEVELVRETGAFGYVNYSCPRCGLMPIEIEDEYALRKKCLRMLNMQKFKGAKLIRLDDWYTPEIKQKENAKSGYWIKTEVKTDKDGDTIIVVYVGHKDFKEKTQFFIKPEKGQLASDHKDMDPAKVLSKIEVHFKGRKLTQEFDD